MLTPATADIPSNGNSSRGKALKVGIVGAGTAGTYLAGLLARQGLSVTLFERSPSPRAEGCGIMVVTSGLEALHRGSPELCQRIVESGAVARSYEFINLRGKVVSTHIAEYEEGEQPSMLIHRSHILDALVDFLPPNCELHTGAAIASLSQTEDSVTAHFTDGSSWTGDVLVGSDGIFSTVRDFVVPGIRPQYLGDIVWRGVVPDSEFCVDGNFKVYIRGRGIYANFFDIGDGFTHWGFFTETPQLDDERDRPRPNNTAIPSEELAKLPDAPRAIIEATDTDDTKCRFSFDIDPLPYIHKGRVILIGDSAHAKSPTRARGMTAGFEDALCLAGYLSSAEADSIPAALEAFQAERLPIVHEYQHSSREVSQKTGRKRRIVPAAKPIQPQPSLAAAQ